MPSRNQPVAPVVPLPAHDDGAPAVGPAHHIDGGAGDRTSRSLHQGFVGDAPRLRRPVERRRLIGGEDGLHPAYRHRERNRVRPLVRERHQHLRDAEHVGTTLRVPLQDDRWCAARMAADVDVLPAFAPISAERLDRGLPRREPARVGLRGPRLPRRSTRAPPAVNTRSAHGRDAARARAPSGRSHRCRRPGPRSPRGKARPPDVWRVRPGFSLPRATRP